MKKFTVISLLIFILGIGTVSIDRGAMAESAEGSTAGRSVASPVLPIFIDCVNNLSELHGETASVDELVNFNLKKCCERSFGADGWGDGKCVGYQKLLDGVIAEYQKLLKEAIAYARGHVSELITKKNEQMNSDFIWCVENLNRNLEDLSKPINDIVSAKLEDCCTKQWGDVSADGKKNWSDGKCVAFQGKDQDLSAATDSLKKWISSREPDFFQCLQKQKIDKCCTSWLGAKAWHEQDRTCGNIDKQKVSELVQTYFSRCMKTRANDKFCCELYFDSTAWDETKLTCNGIAVQGEKPVVTPAPVSGPKITPQEATDEAAAKEAEAEKQADD